MCTTIYGSKRDYRQAMRDPNGSARAHAVCRRLTGCASQQTRWYGAHYWAACALLGPWRRLGGTERLEERTKNVEWYRRAFLREVYGCNEPAAAGLRYDRLYALAVLRVQRIVHEAEALPTSLAW